MASEKSLIAEVRGFSELCYLVLSDKYRTQKEMADAVGVSAPTLSRLFSHTTRYPRFMTIQKLARVANEMRSGLWFDVDGLRVSISPPRKRKRVA